MGAAGEGTRADAGAYSDVTGCPATRAFTAWIRPAARPLHAVPQSASGILIAALPATPCRRRVKTSVLFVRF